MVPPVAGRVKNASAVPSAVDTSVMSETICRSPMGAAVMV
jgi:hypothetical protein